MARHGVFQLRAECRREVIAAQTLEKSDASEWDRSPGVIPVLGGEETVMNLQDAKRSELYSNETYGDEYGKRAEGANVIKFILAIFGNRTNKKVREQRETNTM